MNGIQTEISRARRKAGEDLTAFGKLYCSHYHKLSPPKFHKDLYLELQYLGTIGYYSKLAIAAPRESAKSTVVSLEYVLQSICYKKDKFILLCSATSEQAADLLSHIREELQSNEKIAEDFPEVSEVGSKPKPPRWSRNEIVTRNGVRVLAIGTGQSVRGRRQAQNRPALIILDDIESDETGNNSDSFDKLDSWVTRSVLKAGTETTKVIIVGTIHHYNSLLARFVDPNDHPGWKKYIYQSVIEWSPRQDLWERWSRIFNNQEKFNGQTGKDAAERFFLTHEEEMLEGTKVLWPEKKGYYALMVLREEDGYASFDSEMQNNPIDPNTAVFNLKDVHWWSDRFNSPEELISSLGDHAQFYGACDPSMGKSNRSGDLSAIVTMVKHGRTGEMYIVDVDAARRHPDKIIDAILAHHERYNYRRFGFETNQFQEFMADELEKRARASGKPLTLSKIRHSTDKRARIESLQPLIKNGSIQLSRQHYVLSDQMRYFPKGHHDDALDALEMAVQMCKEGEGCHVYFPDIPGFNGRDYSSSNYSSSNYQLEQVLTAMSRSCRGR